MKTISDHLNDFCFRLLPAIMGALMGSALGLLVFFAFRTAGDITGDQTIVFGRFLLIATLFVVTLTSNTLATMLVILANKDDFRSEMRRPMLHVFGMIIGLFVCCALPILFIHQAAVLSFAHFLLPFSAVMSSLILMTFDPGQNTITRIYLTAAGGFAVGVISGIVFPHIIPYEMMLFFALPLSWSIMSVAQLLVHIVVSGISVRT